MNSYGNNEGGFDGAETWIYVDERKDYNKFPSFAVVVQLHQEIVENEINGQKVNLQ